jgi:hypothetical protein
MLGASRADWKAAERGPDIVQVTARLEQLGQELLRARKSSSLRRENL